MTFMYNNQKDAIPCISHVSGRSPVSIGEPPLGGQAPGVPVWDGTHKQYLVILGTVSGAGYGFDAKDAICSRNAPTNETCVCT